MTTLAAAAADPRWTAVLRRDAAADGAFVYAVRTTGVYCRPSCPSRRPLRRNVLLLPGPAAAREAGFRPCRRCTPDAPGRPDPALDVVLAACRAIDDDPAAARLDDLGRRVGMSPHHLQRAFTRVAGLSPRRYAAAVRFERFKRALREGDPVARALHRAGYGSARGLYERAAANLGMAPAAYRRGGPGVDVAWGSAATPLGPVVVAATPVGVCAVRFGPPAEVAAGLAGELPGARLRRDQRGLAGLLALVREAVAGTATLAELPLDVRGTAFQWRVWEELARIPPGRTLGYGEVAARLGAPGAARAVARACAANPVALAVPCHRVVPAAGGPGGYRWGPERKAALLRREAAGT